MKPLHICTVIAPCPALVQRRLRHLGEYIILDARLKYLEVPAGYRFE